MDVSNQWAWTVVEPRAQEMFLSGLEWKARTLDFRSSSVCALDLSRNAVENG